LQAKKVKNISKDPFGSQLGRVHMPKQDLRRLPTRNMKGLRKTEAEKKVERAKRTRLSSKGNVGGGGGGTGDEKKTSNRSQRNRRGRGSGGGPTGANTIPLALSKMNTRQNTLSTGKSPMMLSS